MYTHNKALDNAASVIYSYLGKNNGVKISTKVHTLGSHRPIVWEKEQAAQEVVRAINSWEYGIDGAV